MTQPPPKKPSKPRPHSAPTLLVITRFCPLDGTSGAGTYLFSILRYLHSQGVKIHVGWSEGPESIGRLGWYRVPKEFARIANLQFPGAISLGRLRIFPAFFLDPFKKRITGALKKSLFALGFESLYRKFRPIVPPPEPINDNPESPEPILYAWDRPPDRFEREFFGRTIARLQPDALLFNFCWMSPLIDDLSAPDQFLKIILTNDLRHLYSTLVNGRIQHTEGDYMSKALEIRYLQPADTLAAIREDDAETFHHECPQHEVLVIPPSFTPSPALQTPLPHRCLFVASDSFANHEGLLWFLESAWPAIRAAQPETKLHVCGSICKVLTPNQPGVVLRGFVDSLQSVYDEAAVVIVPLLRGSGVKIKLMEALAHGKACVTTPIGTEGMPTLDDCVLTASTASEFAVHVLRLLNDATLRQTHEQRALATIAGKFSPAACYGPLYQRIVHFHNPS